MLIVGLTGGIASGKSTLATALSREPGIEVIDADRIAWQTYRSGTPLFHALVERFGEQIIRADGEIDRKRLGSIVFRDEAARHALNDLVHPVVRRRLRELAQAAEGRGVEILIIEAALFLDRPRVDRSLIDQYLLLVVPPEVQCRRLQSRDGLSAEEARRRVSAQSSDQERIARADHVIDASGPLEETLLAVRTLLQRLSH